NLTLPDPLVSGSGTLAHNTFIVINTAQAVVNNVSATNSDGSYGAGTVIDITIAFSENVTVTTSGGIPPLTLNAVASSATPQNVVATYFDGSGSNILHFHYTVAAGDNNTIGSLDYASPFLVLHGGTIKDTDGAHVDADLTLPNPGDPGSLSANKT